MRILSIRIWRHAEFFQAGLAPTGHRGEWSTGYHQIWVCIAWVSMVGVPQHVSTLLKINCGIRSDSAAHATIEVSGMNQRKNLPKLAMTT